MTEKRDQGYLMVALLVSMAVAAVWVTVLLPAWRQQALRQKEDDLIFRGEQYARAIALFYCKNQVYPATVDILVTQKFLRKKWKDPITDKDFLLVPAPSPSGQQPAQPVGGRAGAAPPVGMAQGSQMTTGFLAVRSQSAATSIKIYQQQQVYNQWPFDMQRAMQQMPNCLGQQGQPGRGGQQPGGAPGGRAGDGRGGTSIGPAPGGRPAPGGPVGPGGAGPGGPGRAAPPPAGPGRGRGN